MDCVSYKWNFFVFSVLEGAMLVNLLILSTNEKSIGFVNPIAVLCHPLVSQVAWRSEI